MTPDTIHLLVQDIRNVRAMLTALEKWARSLDSYQAKVEVFQRVNFWRKLLTDAEQKIESGHASESQGQSQG